jgi:uncharacterized protein YbjT (DUF2867 family)
MFVIAGVTGHVGSVVANELLAKKSPVKVIVRDSAKGAPWAKKGAQVAVGGLQDVAFLTATLKGAEGFFTLLPPDFAAPDFYAAQRKTADAIASAVKASGIPHVVMLSSVGAHLATGNGPIRGLHYLENALRAAGTTLSAIRAGYFQENAANSLAPARQAGIVPNFLASADFAIPMIATRDIGLLAAKLLIDKPKKSEAIDLQGPAYSIRQVAEKLGAALGKALKVVDIPPAGWLDAMKKGGIPEHVAKVFAEMYAGFNSGAIKPQGDRLVQGKTELDEVIRAIVSSAASMAV